MFSPNTQVAILEARRNILETRGIQNSKIIKKLDRRIRNLQRKE